MPEPDDVPPWTPRADVFVNAAGDLVIKVELAGLRKENLEITIDGQRLILTGRRPNPDAEDAQYLTTKLEHGRFHLVLEAPEEFDCFQARAAYQNGLLRIVTPRRGFDRWTNTA